MRVVRAVRFGDKHLVGRDDVLPVGRFDVKRAFEHVEQFLARLVVVVGPREVFAGCHLEVAAWSAWSSAASEMPRRSQG